MPYARVEKSPCGVGIGQAAAHEHLSQNVTHAQDALQLNRGTQVVRPDLEPRRRTRGRGRRNDPKWRPPLLLDG
jgi:hypothetical protein